MANLEQGIPLINSWFGDKIMSGDKMLKDAVLNRSKYTTKTTLMIWGYLYIMLGCFWPSPHFPPTHVKNSKYFDIPPPNIM